VRCGAVRRIEVGLICCRKTVVRVRGKGQSAWAEERRVRWIVRWGRS
jgi:hypothetical protein